MRLQDRSPRGMTRKTKKKREMVSTTAFSNQPGFHQYTGIRGLCMDQHIGRPDIYWQRTKSREEIRLLPVWSDLRRRAGNCLLPGTMAMKGRPGKLPPGMSLCDTKHLSHLFQVGNSNIRINNVNLMQLSTVFTLSSPLPPELKQSASSQPNQLIRVFTESSSLQQW